MTEEKLSKLITKAASLGELTELKRRSGQFSPGFIDVCLCGETIESFDTYYYTASNSSKRLALGINARIESCKTDIIETLKKQVAELTSENNTLKLQS